ncbi:MAG TPA: hypothetical protein VLJ88_00140 [Propionibacteriaceae bacterium]|nr:hypothetical protein [Propionibacteriaceae bacterium]
MTVGRAPVVGRSLVGIGLVHLATTGAWGVSMMPKSGFRLLFPVVALAAVQARASRVPG